MTDAQTKVHHHDPARDFRRTSRADRYHSRGASASRRKPEAVPPKMEKAGSAPKKPRRSQEEDRLTVNISRPGCFLNLSFDRSYDDIFLAYLVGLSIFGIDPISVLLAPANGWRLPKLYETIRASRFSIHDMSWNRPNDIRYNMPLELGLAVAAGFDSSHTYFVFESKPYRIQKRLSDLNGVDVRIHRGTPFGVLGEMLNLFGRTRETVRLEDLHTIYRRVRRWRKSLASRNRKLVEPAFLRQTIRAINEIVLSFQTS